MIRRISSFFSAVMERYLPDAYIFAIILTFVTAVLSLIFTDTGPVGVVSAWGNGLWNILTFTMQMVLILVTGYALALSKPVKRLVQRIASIPQSPAQAVALVTVFAGVATWIQWGFGLIVSGILALEVARRMQRVDFPLLIAAAYTGMAVWHMGLSGSVPLTIATAGSETNFVEQATGSIVPISASVLAPWNIIPTIIMIAATALVLMRSNPEPERVRTVDPEVIDDTESSTPTSKQSFNTPAERLENSPVLTWMIGLLGIAYIVWWFATEGFSLDLNIVIGIFLFLGILFHGTPMNYVGAMKEAVQSASGIVLQFPFYGGIQGIMAGTGLVAVIANWFVAISTPLTFFFWQFLAAGLINVFVPSGGGQWATMGPITIQTAQDLGLNLTEASMMVAWGDQWTNMIQPFWALPLLGLAGLQARDIMGYATLVLLVGLVVLGGASFVVALL